MQDCLFCKIIAGQIPSELVYQDEQVYAFLDINPTNPGHILVVPKQHSTGLLDAEPVTLSTLMPVVQRLAVAMKKVTQADGLNVIQNEGAAAGQMIQHLHFHLVPRKIGDGFEAWHGKPYASVEMMKAMGEQIRSQLV